MRTYGEDRLLSLDPNDDTLLLDGDIEILSFQGTRDFNRDVYIGDCLDPFVRESGLFFSFLCAGSCLFCGGWFCGEGLAVCALQISGRLAKNENTISTFNICHFDGVVAKCRICVRCTEGKALEAR